MAELRSLTDLAPGLARKVTDLMRSLGVDAPDSRAAGQQRDCAWFAEQARLHGIALVDPTRQRHLVDETVYAGALFRLRQAEARLRPHVVVPPAAWLALKPEDDLAIPAFLRRASA